VIALYVHIRMALPQSEDAWRSFDVYCAVPKGAEIPWRSGIATSRSFLGPYKFYKHTLYKGAIGE
jgi:hypothetical protein